MKLWVVLSGDYDGHDVVGVFDNKPAASAHKAYLDITLPDAAGGVRPSVEVYEEEVQSRSMTEAF